MEIPRGLGMLSAFSHQALCRLHSLCQQVGPVCGSNSWPGCWSMAGDRVLRWWGVEWQGMSCDGHNWLSPACDRDASAKEKPSWRYSKISESKASEAWFHGSMKWQKVLSASVGKMGTFWLLFSTLTIHASLRLKDECPKSVGNMGCWWSVTMCLPARVWWKSSFCPRATWVELVQVPESP